MANKNPLPIGTIPTALAEYLTIVTGISPEHIMPILAAIAATDARAHQSLNVTKTQALSLFRSKLGIACPSPITGSFPQVDPCECCKQATPTRWFIGPTEHQSELYVGPMPLIHHLTKTLLTKCFTNYVKKSPNRLDPERGDWVENYTLPYIPKLFLDRGAYTCWSCASPILCERLLCNKTTLMPPPTIHNLELLEDRALFLRHTLLTPHTMKGKIKNFFILELFPILLQSFGKTIPADLTIANPSGLKMHGGFPLYRHPHQITQNFRSRANYLVSGSFGCSLSNHNNMWRGPSLPRANSSKHTLLTTSTRDLGPSWNLTLRRPLKIRHRETSQLTLSSFLAPSLLQAYYLPTL